MEHRVVSQEEWLAARKQLLRKEKEFTRFRDQLSAERRELPWVRWTRSTSSMGRTAKRRSPICSTGAASSWSITSCSARDGSRVARAARSCPITSTAQLAPAAPRRHPAGGLAGAACADRGLQAAHGLALQVGVVLRKRLQPRLPRVVHPGRNGAGRGVLQLHNDRVPERGGARPQRVLQGPERRGLSHLLHLCARARHAGRRLQLSRPCAQGPRRGALPWTMAWVRHHDRYGD